jgi:lycopene cyclase domain-containing protein
MCSTGGRTVPEYTVAAFGAVATVLVLELVVLRTGLFGRAAFWITITVCFAFQVLVDGWLTKRSAPIVRYRESATIGVRFPWSIPVEDFLFGFAMLTLVLLLWERAGATARRDPVRSP